MDIAGKLFVVTGGGNGMGRETALLLLERGARVAAVDLSEEGLAGTVERAGAGAPISTHTLNIADRAAVEALPAAVEAAHGAPADALINVAGIIHRFVKVQELSIEEIERVIDVNFWGTVYTTKAFLPGLLTRPSAALVNFASMGALIPFPGQGAYGASKGAVKLFTETLLAELRSTNVQVQIVYPGAVMTNIAGNSGVSAPGGDQPAAAEPQGKSSMQGTTVERAAEIIVDGIAKGGFRIFIGKDSRMFDRLSRLSPTKSIVSIASKVGPMLGIR